MGSQDTINCGNQKGRPRKSQRSNGGHQHGNSQSNWLQNTRPNEARDRIAKPKNKGNEKYQGQKSWGTTNNANNKRPVCANQLGKLLSPLPFDFATLRALLSVVFSMSDVLWATCRKGGKSPGDIAKELPLLDCVRLYNLSNSLLEMAQAPDNEGDIPMLDIDGVVASGRNSYPTLDGLSVLLWEFITTYGEHTQT